MKNGNGNSNNDGDNTGQTFGGETEDGGNESEEQKGETQEPDTSLEYTLSDDGTYYTASGMGTCTNTDMIMCSTYDDSPITAIANEAFECRASLESATV